MFYVGIEKQVAEKFFSDPSGKGNNLVPIVAQIQSAKGIYLQCSCHGCLYVWDYGGGYINLTTIPWQARDDALHQKDRE
jgi:hypothetical protein